MIDTKVIFEDAHTHIAWQDRSVPDDRLRQIYDIAKLGPNFLCNLGYGGPAQVRPRNPRPSFEEACRIV